MATKKFPPFFQADDWFTIAPSDTVNFADDTSNNPKAYPLAAIFVGTGGNITLVSGSGVAKTFLNVPSGTFMPCLAKRVNNTNTAAADILGMVGLGSI